MVWQSLKNVTDFKLTQLAKLPFKFILFTNLSSSRYNKEKNLPAFYSSH